MAGVAGVLSVWQALATPLPVVFRVSQDRSVVPAWIRHRLQHWAQEFNVRAASASASAADGEEAASSAAAAAFVPPSQLPWDPRGRMWYLKASRDAVRKDPALQRFHEFLKVRVLCVCERRVRRAHPCARSFGLPACKRRV